MLDARLFEDSLIAPPQQVEAMGRQHEWRVEPGIGAYCECCGAWMNSKKGKVFCRKNR